MKKLIALAIGVLAFSSFATTQCSSGTGVECFGCAAVVVQDYTACSTQNGGATCCEYIITEYNCPIPGTPFSCPKLGDGYDTVGEFDIPPYFCNGSAGIGRCVLPTP